MTFPELMHAELTRGYNAIRTSPFYLDWNSNPDVKRAFSQLLHAIPEHGEWWLWAGYVRYDLEAPASAAVMLQMLRRPMWLS